MPSHVETIPPVCETCHDNRFVARHVDARRYTGGNTPSHVFPCPACGPFLLDGDGKRYGVPGRRYGNPLSQTEHDYFVWRARNASKASGWQDLALFESELSTEKRLRELYPGSSRRWTRVWVLGQREVQLLPAAGGAA